MTSSWQIEAICMLNNSFNIARLQQVLGGNGGGVVGGMTFAFFLRYEYVLRCQSSRIMEPRTTNNN